MVELKHDDGTYHKVYFDRTVKEKNLDKAKENVLQKNNSFVIVVDGRSGIGKTTVAIQFAKYLDPNFTIEQMSWSPDKFIKQIENSKKGQCFIFDESMVFSSRAATSRVNRAIVIALSQIRSRNIFIILNINSVFDLDRNVSLHRLDLLYHLYNKDDVTNSERRMKVYGRSKIKYLYINGKKYYSYSTHPNFFAKPSGKYIFLIDEAEYEKRKRKESMANTDMEGTLGRREAVYRLAFVKLVDSMKRLYDVTHLEVSEIVGIDSPRISKLLSWAKEKKYIKDDREEIDNVAI